MLRTLFRLLLLLLVAAAALAWFGWDYAHRPMNMDAEQVEFTIERGASMRQIAQIANDAGVDTEPELLYWLARLTGHDRRIKAGSYAVDRGTTPLQLLAKLSAGEVTQGMIRLVEGWNFRQLRTAIESHPELKQDTLELSNAEILQRIGATELHPEGLFFPDTYLFDKNSSALDVFRRAYRAMQKELDAAWAQRALVPLKSPYEVLILASIIEKETGRPEDRGLVASVFVNRLDKDMLLQTDPTVAYGFGEELQGRLRKRHLETDHPWNTYLYKGLPPSPIAMPGRASIMAAVKPEQSSYYYFVSRGDGSSEFSRNLNDHNRAVRRYQLGGK